MAPKAQFQFVEDKSRSNGDDIEKRRLVRSNATKFRWQQSRSEKLKRNKATARPEIMKIAFEVGSGIFDPFETVPTSLPPDAVTRGMNYNKNIIIPKLMPLAGAASEKLQIILPIAVNNRALFNCLMVGAMVHQQAARKFLGSRESRLLLQCRDEAVSELRKNLTDSANATCDVTILSVLVLAFTGPMAKYPPPRRFPSQGPLQYLQSLSIYSSIEIQEAHLRGLRTLIKVRGGLGKLTLPGLAPIVSTYALHNLPFNVHLLKSNANMIVPSGDIVRATETLEKPLYEPFSLVKGSIPQISVSTIANVRSEASTLVNLSTGFQVLDQSALGRRLREATEMMADYSVFVGGLAPEQRPSEKNYIIDQRNLVQHHLMSLPSYEEIPNASRPTNLALYESCRLSSIIFSILVIMPMNYATAPFERLAHNLKSMLGRTILQQHQEMRIWVSTMGAIAAFSLQEDDYFIAELARAAISLQLKHWEDYQAVLQKFLWLPATNDVDGRYLWSTISSLVV